MKMTAIEGVGCGMVLFQGLCFIAFIMGLFHAFTQSVWLGILAFFFSPVTILIEMVDWFSTKELWVELGTIVNGVMG